MARQLQNHLRSLAPLTALVAAVALWTGCSGGESFTGIRFEPKSIDLGRFNAGPVRELSFPFEVRDEQVVIDSADPDCGCLAPSLWVGGKLLLPRPASKGGGWLLKPGSEGELRVSYATAGYRGRKRTGVFVRGTGPGLPLKLEVDSWLDAWFKLTPDPVQMGKIDGRMDARVEVVVRGEELFRITEVLGGAAPLEVEGLPNSTAALEQRFVILLPARPEESGRRAAILNMGTDIGRSFRVSVGWEWTPEVWVQPWPRLILTGLNTTAETFAAIEVGTDAGTMKPLQVELTGVPGAETEVVEEVPGRRYRVKLKLPAGLPAGSLKGSLRLRTDLHRPDGSEETVERELPILGLVSEASTR